MFSYEKTHRHLKTYYQIFDNLKTKDRKIRKKIVNLKVKSHKLEWSSLLICFTFSGKIDYSYGEL